MTKIFPRGAAQTLPIVSHGDGPYLIDEAGKRYLDGSCGPATSCLGHSDAAVSQAIKDQIDQVAFAHTSFFTSRPAEALAEKLIAHAPGELDRVYLVSGGSEAVEAALKLCRQYFLETGRPERRYVIARRQSYHGNTLGALATGGNLARREAFAPLLMNTSHIAPCYEYRYRQDGESTFEYGQRAADELDQEIRRLGPDNVMAFVAEPVVGATAGAVPAVEGYFRRIRDICTQHGVLLVLDEVMCGMGRTGTLFACEQDGIAPDILVTAKGLGAGYQPIGAMLCTGAIYQAVREGSGFFQHGHTYLGHPVAAAAALAVLGRLVDDGLVERCRQMGEQVRAALIEQFEAHPHVGDIRGRGLFLGLELVADRESREPFPAADKVHQKVKRAAFEAGLICYPAGGTIDGTRGDHILIAPPFIIDETHVRELTDRLSLAIGQATG